MQSFHGLACLRKSTTKTKQMSLKFSLLPKSPEFSHSFQSSYSHKIWIKFSASTRESLLIIPEHPWKLPFKSLLCLYLADGYSFGTTCPSFKNFCTLFSQLSILFLFSTFFFLSSFFFGIFFHQRVKCLPAMQKTGVWSLRQEDLLEKERATHSRTLAWRIPWTQEPGGLQSTGSQSLILSDFTFTFKSNWCLHNFINEISFRIYIYRDKRHSSHLL